jgi:hypothetical protein
VRCTKEQLNNPEKYKLITKVQASTLQSMLSENLVLGSENTQLKCLHTKYITFEQRVTNMVTT